MSKQSDDIKGDLEQDARKILEIIEQLILAEKASGGYKFRPQIRLSNQELKDFIDRKESWLRMMAVSLIVAEQMLQETKPAYQAYHNRWVEYVRRRAECSARIALAEQLGKKR